MSLFHYYRGVRVPSHSKELRSHGRLIMIDDSGDLGTDSSFYVLIAAVTDNRKNIEKITRVFPPTRRENKHYYSLDETKVKVLTELEMCDIDIYAVSYNKSKLDLSTPKKKKEHNLSHLLELIELVLRSDTGRVYDMIIDNTSMMDGYEDLFVKMCYQVAGLCGKIIENIEMKDSSGTKVLQIHDYAAGTIGGHTEHMKDVENAYHERFAIITSKIREIVEK